MSHSCQQACIEREPTRRMSRRERNQSGAIQGMRKIRAPLPDTARSRTRTCGEVTRFCQQSVLGWESE